MNDAEKCQTCGGNHTKEWHDYRVRDGIKKMSIGDKKLQTIRHKATLGRKKP